MKKTAIYIGVALVALFSALALLGKAAKLDDFDIEFDDDF